VARRWVARAQRRGAAIIAAGALQAYLAFRVEFDRAIFEAAAAGMDTFERFDAALAAFGLARRAPGRPVEERARGLWTLVKCSGSVFMLQAALAGAAVWAGR
jgi:hypothetical protein